MTALKFTDAEITALAVIEGFGIVDATDTYYKEAQFSNQYYKNLMKLGKADKGIVLPSDEFLLSDKNPYKVHVQKFAEDKKMLFATFERAFIKVSRIGYEPKHLSNLAQLFDSVELRNP